MPQKTVEIPHFFIDFPAQKSQGIERQGSENPHEHRGFVLTLPRSHSLHAVRSSRQEPRQRHDRRRTHAWQLD